MWGGRSGRVTAARLYTHSVWPLCGKPVAPPQVQATCGAIHTLPQTVVCTIQFVPEAAVDPSRSVPDQGSPHLVHRALISGEIAPGNWFGVPKRNPGHPVGRLFAQVDVDDGELVRNRSC